MKQEITLTCYALPASSALDNIKFEKGREHDRQALGFILPANTLLQIRQPDNHAGHARLRLLANDSNVEKSITLNDSWQTVSTTVDSVPFIDTLFFGQGGEFSVIYQQPASVKTLPLWRKGLSEEAFFLDWEKQASPFALLELKRVRFLLPLADRPHVISATLAALDDYYTQVIDAYDDWTGLCDTPDSPLNQNIANRYFIKADKHGVGSAYYLPWWCAQTAATLSQGWIDNVATQWTILHEIGHGYQGVFMNDADLPVGEVWNNIYAAFFQQRHLGQEQHLYTDGWLYNYGRQPEQELQLITHIRNHTPVSSWGVRSRLQFLMLMLFKAGTKAFRVFNQNYRALGAGENFLPCAHQLTDLLADAIATASGYDVTPFIQLCGLTVEAFTREQIATQAVKPVWPLYDLLPEREWESARQQLGLDSFVWLVENAELAALNKTGTLTLTLNIEQPEQLYGRPLTLHDNAGNTYTLPVNDSTLTLTTLPIGIYHLTLPKGRSQKYRPDADYVVIREGENALTVNFTRLQDSAAHNEQLTFLGYGDMPFARLVVDYEARQLVLDINNATPHSYFANTLYASITVLTASGEKVFERKMNGTNCATGKTIVPFSDHYHLYLYHAEPGRLKGLPGELALISPAKYQLLRIDNEGLYHFTLNNDPAADLLKIFNLRADAIRACPSLMAQPYAACKNDLRLMLSHIEEPTRSALMRASADVLPADNDEPGEGIGKGVTLHLRGQGAREFCQLAYDNRQQRITITTRAGQPHPYYTATYSTLTVTDASGGVSYSRHYDGITNYPVDSDTVALQAGMYIELFHDEPYRCSAVNETTGQNVTLKKHNRWRVALDGLEVDSPEQTEEKSTSDAAALYGDKFTWQLLGEEDNDFANMEMDLGAKQLTFTARPVTPHSAFTTEYAAVTVYNTRGTVIYRQSIKGSVQLGGYRDACGLEEEYTIEVFHAEGGRRSMMTNPLTDESWPQPQRVIWQVTARGLQRLTAD
ncbi:viral enhancin protein [Salmonella enterica subsp. salamae]|nr:viral enhancin protein [Salmonella enterica subsp. salamae]ECJ2279910.1 viral enhancin protein [Salmonella enterica subsp. salamae]